MNGEADMDSDTGCQNLNERRRVSPAPVSRFAPRIPIAYNKGTSLNSNRVSLPFNRFRSVGVNLLSPFNKVD